MDRSTKEKTLEHIQNVREKIGAFILKLGLRGFDHDKSKLSGLEMETFGKYTPLLSKTTYGSDEYKQMLLKMKPALDHHYANNSHHPEFYQSYECNGCFKLHYPEVNICDVCGYSQFTTRPDTSRMNLVDVVEMFCDWQAAVERHDDGDILKSIEINANRFNMSDQLKNIFINTVNV